MSDRPNIIIIDVVDYVGDLKTLLKSNTSLEWLIIRLYDALFLTELVDVNDVEKITDFVVSEFSNNLKQIPVIPVEAYVLIKLQCLNFIRKLHEFFKHTEIYEVDAETGFFVIKYAVDHVRDNTLYLRRIG